jgi:periplasmic copper chaperone A
MNRVLRTAALALGATAIGVLALATPASAHVTVNGDAKQGGYSRVAFRVPTESDTASTTRVEVHLPEETPIASVSTMPVPGWTVTTTKTKLAQPIKSDDGDITEAVSVITWTAGAGAAIKPGEFQEFPVSLGPLPNVDQLVFKALQTYSDGTIVRWIEEPAPGGQEPEHPAPVLKVLPASSSGDSTAAPAPAAPSSDSDNGTAIGIGVAGLVVGAAGLVFGLLAYARTRRTPAPAPSAAEDKAAVS